MGFVFSTATKGRNGISWDPNRKTISFWRRHVAGKLRVRAIPRGNLPESWGGLFSYVSNRGTAFLGKVRPVRLSGGLSEGWGSADIQRIQSFQSKVLHTIPNAPWYVSNQRRLYSASL